MTERRGLSRGGVLSQAFRPPWWMAVYPLAVTPTMLSANLFGDPLQDHLDPRLTRA